MTVTQSQGNTKKIYNYIAHKDAHVQQGTHTTLAPKSTKSQNSGKILYFILYNTETINTTV